MADFTSLNGYSVADATARASNSSQDALLVNNAPKNLLNFDVDSCTEYGIRFNVYKNSSNATTKVEVSGTSTYYTFIESSPFVLPAGNYILNGFNSSLGLFLALRNGATDALIGVTRNGEYSFTSNGSQSYKVRIYVDKGYTISLSSIYPMIRRAAVTDDTFEPYYRSQKQLHTDLAALENELQSLTSRVQTLENS